MQTTAPPPIAPTPQTTWLRRLLRIWRHPHWRYLIARFLGVKLGVLRQYQPRPLRVPRRYHRLPRTTPTLRISLVTPSYNQGRFLEHTIRSVLEQDYPHLQYIVQDGGSSDDTRAILERWRSRLDHCESVADRGQAHAVNLGFRHAAGDVMAWLNSDDLLLPGSLHYIAKFFQRHPDVDVIYGHRVLIDEQGREIGRWVLPPHDDTMLSWADYVPQETMFWRRRVWEQVGGAMDESFQFALDWDLLLRFREAGARFYRVPRFLGAFRVHAEQKTSAQRENVGNHEMQRLYERIHQQPMDAKTCFRQMLPYLCRHAVCQRLYQIGVLRY
jgi:carbamoyltransferase